MKHQSENGEEKGKRGKCKGRRVWKGILGMKCKVGSREILGRVCLTPDEGTGV